MVGGCGAGDAEAEPDLEGEFELDIVMWYWVESRENVLLEMQCRETVFYGCRAESFLFCE